MKVDPGAEKYYHWVITRGGRFYLGYNFISGYEELFSEEEKERAERFLSKEPFDKRYWLPRKSILKEGVEPANG